MIDIDQEAISRHACTLMDIPGLFGMPLFNESRTAGCRTTVSVRRCSGRNRRRVFWYKTTALLLSVLMAPFDARAQSNASGSISFQFLPIAPADLTERSLLPEDGRTVHARFQVQKWSPKGWGLFATADQRSADLSNGAGWRFDPAARHGQVEIGFGWRGDELSFVAGYARTKSFRREDDPSKVSRAFSLVGVSIDIPNP